MKLRKKYFSYVSIQGPWSKLELRCLYAYRRPDRGAFAVRGGRIGGVSRDEAAEAAGATPAIAKWRGYGTSRLTSQLQKRGWELVEDAVLC